VNLEAAADGMCWLTAYLPLEVGSAIDTHLDAVARSLQSPNEHRGLAQLRADALADLALGCGAPASASALAAASVGLAPGGLATAGGASTSASAGPVTASSTEPGGWPAARGRAPSGIRCEVVVTIPAATLAGNADTPAEILGYGPLDAETARALAGEAATWTKLWVDPSNGAPLAIGRTRYVPTAAMRRFLGARDHTCRFPGCDRPPAATEADHTHEWADGGPTGTDNLALLCREHHRLKSLGHWTVAHIGARQDHAVTRGRAAIEGPADPRPQPGTLEWTSPSGRTYVTYPHNDEPPPF
jgi:hypothetical protein